jgi:hypothetical protein
MEGGRTMNLSHGYLVGDMGKVDQNPGRIEKPWEAMYRAILRRFTEIVKNEEGMEAVARIVLSHNGLMADYDADLKKEKQAEWGPQEVETLKAMEKIAKTLPTDGNLITPGMLDSKTDLQALIDGTETFRTIKTVDANACPGANLAESDETSTR